MYINSFYSLKYEIVKVERVYLIEFYVEFHYNFVNGFLNYCEYVILFFCIYIKNFKVI